MLDKLITNIKNSLPGAKKNDEEEEQDVEETLDSDEEGVENSSEEEKKKKVSMMIRVGIILALGYLAVDHFILNPEQDPTVDQLAANAPVKRKRPRPVVKPPEETAEAQTIKEEKKEEVSQAETPTASTSADTSNLGSTSTESPVENINITNKSSDETAPVVTEPPAEETSSTVSTPMGENTLDSRLDQLIDNVEQKEKTPTKAPNLADKIVEEEVQTSPPPYDVLGRGLVYNCKDKFWACIDKPNYVTCNKNMKWNKSRGNPQECVIQSVYSSDEDCIKVQKYNVSSNQPTSFCQ
jgi:cytoskeletal protein RodZ